MLSVQTQFEDYYRNKSDYYQLLAQQLTALLEIEQNVLTNMAQTSAFIMQSIPELNWVGFYRNQEDQKLLLGPFQGKVACVHIPFGQGVCGTVAENRKSIRVDDVHAFDGHIACDSASNAEIVIPLVHNETLFGVLDIDSPILNRFDDQDLAGLERLAKVFINASILG